MAIAGKSPAKWLNLLIGAKLSKTMFEETGIHYLIVSIN